jgi:Zn-finger nucleic acid-binding protein
MIIDKSLTCVNGCGVLTPNQYEGVDVAICTQCKGVWLNYKNLNAIIENEGNIWTEQQRAEILQQTGKAGVPDTELERHLNCPECGELMPAINYQYSSGIIINKCKNNHGVWLDSGELTKIQIYKEACKTHLTLNH